MKKKPIKKKIRAWAVVQTKNEPSIPIFNAGFLKSVPDVLVWAIFTEKKQAEKVLKISRKGKKTQADRYTKVIPIEITYSLEK